MLNFNSSGDEQTCDAMGEITTNNEDNKEEVTNFEITRKSNYMSIRNIA